MIVGGLGNRGVVSAASYEARRFGVHSAMPMARARAHCPGAVFLPPRFGVYEEHSRAVMDVCRSVTPLVEQLSVDEAFLDVAGAKRISGAPDHIARQLRERIRRETGLVASIGAATTKFLAKLASDLAKPDGLLVVAPGSERALLDPLPVERLWGVGPATHERLARLGVHTIGDVRCLPEHVLVHALGTSLGRHLRALSDNEDPRDVVPGHVAKSIGAEETFGADLREPGMCDRELVRLTERLTVRMRRAHLAARTLTLKVRFGDFETITRSHTLPEPTAVSTVILATFRDLLAPVDVQRGIRLLGVSGSHLEEPGPEQGVLDLDEPVTAARRRVARRDAVERAVDAIRTRFGDGVVRAAALVERRAKVEDGGE